MRISAPRASLDDIDPLITAGADELYCGVLAPDSSVDYYPNARAYTGGNLPSFAELAGAVERAGRRGVSVAFCANTPQGRKYSDQVKADILSALRAGVGGIVAGDISMLPWLRKNVGKTAIAMGTFTSTFNARTLEFLADSGVKRVVLDRLLTLSEMERLCLRGRELGLDLEAFIAGITCVNVNSACLLHHWRRRHLPASTRPGGRGRPPCWDWYDLTICSRQGDRFVPRSQGRDYAVTPPMFYCAACALFRLQRCGVAVAKVVGRTFSLQQRLRDLSMVKNYLSGIARGTIDERNFMDTGRFLHKRIYGRDCSWRRCFYHELYEQRRASS